MPRLPTYTESLSARSSTVLDSLLLQTGSGSPVVLDTSLEPQQPPAAHNWGAPAPYSAAPPPAFLSSTAISTGSTDSLLSLTTDLADDDLDLDGLDLDDDAGSFDRTLSVYSAFSALSSSASSLADSRWSDELLDLTTKQLNTFLKT